MQAFARNCRKANQMTKSKTPGGAGGYYVAGDDRQHIRSIPRIPHGHAHYRVKAKA
jgi:hypothetical protein